MNTATRAFADEAAAESTDPILKMIALFFGAKVLVSALFFAAHAAHLG